MRTITVPRSLRAALPASLVLAAALAIAPAAAQSAPLQLTGKVLGPAQAQSYFSSGAAPVGDVNGDGLGDVAVQAGDRVTVLLGTPGEGLRSLPAGDRGFEITLGGAGDQGSARPAGDIDGDGFDDVLIPGSNRSFVVHGAATPASVELPGTAPQVTVVQNGVVGGLASPAGAGDFDGDGFDDLVIRMGTGAAIVRSGPRVSPLIANAAGPRRVLITGIQRCGFRSVFFWECNTSLQAPEPVGDVNGDGKDDLYFTERNFIALGRTGTATIAGTAPDSRAFSTRGVNGVPLVGRPRGFGDFTGDGIDDLLAAPGSADRIWHVIPGRVGTSGTLDAAGSGVIRILPPAATDQPYWFKPAGDTDGDGRADLALASGATARIVAGRPGPATVTVDGVIPPLPLPIGDLKDDFGYPTGVAVTPEGAGDVDGDGAADLIVGSPNSDDEGLADRGALFVLTHGADRIAPALYPRGTTNPERGSTLAPSVFAAAPTGAGTSIRVHLLEPASVELRVRAESGTVLSTETRTALPEGITAIAWDGRSRGVNGIPGKYALELTAVDAAGNRGATQRIPFEVTGSGEVGPPTLSVSRREVVPSGTRVPPPRNVYPYSDPTFRRVVGSCPDSLTSEPLADTPRDVPINDPSAGDACGLYYQPPPAQDNERYPPLPADPAGYPWRTTVSINGAAPVRVAAPPVGDYYVTLPQFALRNGVNTITIVDTWDDAALVVPDSDVTNTLAWSFTGSGGGFANAASGDPASAAGLKLTAASANQIGIAVACPTNFSPNRMVVEFDAEISGGSGSGHGLSFALFDRRPATLLASNANVGFGWVGHPGTAFALITEKERYNPAENFVGIASGLVGKSGYPTWLASAIPGRSLAGATTRVRIEVTGGSASFAIDGTVMLRRAVSFPVGACLGFTAATGTRTQNHIVKNLRVRSS